MRTVVIGAFAVVASLLAVMNLLMTSGYGGRTPGGSDAIGLVIPFFASFISAACLLVATIVAMSDGRLAWIDPPAATAATIALVVAVGIAVAIVCALIAWTERGGLWVAPFGIVAAGISPLMISALLLLSRAPVAGEVAAAPLPRMFAALLVPVAFVGYIVGAKQLVQTVRGSAARAAAMAADDAAFEAKLQRNRNRTPAEAAREDVAEMDPAAPLWAVIAGLPDAHDAEAFDIIAKRALKVPKFDDELAQTIIGKYPHYRRGCLLLIKYQDAAQRQASWSKLVAQSINTSAAEIENDGEWFVSTVTYNPDALAYVVAMRDAAALYPGDSEVANALTRLKAVISAMPPSSARDSAHTILHD